ARPADQPLPRQRTKSLYHGPVADRGGRALSLATPSPCPKHSILMAGAPPDSGTILPGRYGIYVGNDDWANEDGPPVRAADATLQLLFDDPDFLDAEPVAIYPRFVRGSDAPSRHVSRPVIPHKVTLADGTQYDGPGGPVFNNNLYVNLHRDLLSQQ